MAGALKKIHPWRNRGAAALLIALVAAIGLVLLLGWSTDAQAAAAGTAEKLAGRWLWRTLNEIKWLQPVLASLDVFLTRVATRLPALGRLVSAVNVWLAFLSVVVCVVAVAIAEAARAIARVLVKLCTRAYRGVAAAVLRAYFGVAVAINVYLLAIFAALAVSYFLFSDDGSTFVLIAYLALLLLFVFIMALFGLRTGRFFEDDDSVAGLTDFLRETYGGGGGDEFNRQMLIEARARQVAESRTG